MSDKDFIDSERAKAARKLGNVSGSLKIEEAIENRRKEKLKDQAKKRDAHIAAVRKANHLD